MQDDGFDPNGDVVVNSKPQPVVLGSVVSQPVVVGSVVSTGAMQPVVVQGGFVQQPEATGAGAPLMSKSDYPMQPFGDHRNWKDGLCNCFSECSNCCCTCCCGFQQVAMLHERVVQRGSYLIIFCALGFFYIMSLIFDQIAGIIWASDRDASEGLSTTGDWFFFIFWLCSFVITFLVRREVRTKYEIPEQCCPGVEDCCCAFWCLGCTQCQIWRHITGGTAAGAKGCGCTEDPEKGCC